MRSVAEQEIRDAVCSRLRVLLPEARIIHELNTSGQGSSRIDVAAVTMDKIVGVEIKSEKDVMKRLTDQMSAFRKCCHVAVIAAHEKHFREYCASGDGISQFHLDHPEFYGKNQFGKSIWRYPIPTPSYWDRSPWGLKDASDNWDFPLRSSDLLQMLWASELREECGRHRLPNGSRETRGPMIRSMSFLMTGKEVAVAVCRQLRGREFAEADPVIPAQALGIAA